MKRKSLMEILVFTLLLLLIFSVSLSYFLLPASFVKAIFITRWPFWIGGLAIGAFVILFFLGAGKQLGVSTGFSDICSIPYDKQARFSWRLPFLLGIIIGAFIAGLSSNHYSLTFAMGSFDTLFTTSLLFKAIVFTFGGVLIGFGTRLAGGCTSGHGIVGMALMAPSSIIATLTFMTTGFLFTHLLLSL